MDTPAQRIPRVLKVVENNSYPFDVRVRGEAETLMGGGFDVTVICPSAPGRPLHEVIDGVEVYRFPAPREGRGLVGYAWEYGYGTLIILIYTLYVLARKHVDILHVYNPPDTLFVVGLLARLLRKKVVYDYRDPSPELYASKFGRQDGLVYRVLVWLEGMCCRLADLVIAPNEFCRQLVITRHAVSPARVVAVYNAPKLHRFKALPPLPDVRARAATIIGYVGVMSSQDGIDYLLRALHHLKFTLGQGDFFAVLVGPADDMEGLRRLARSLAIDEQIMFTGRLPFGDDLLRYLLSADICVEPSPANPINMISTMTKLTEYMALRRPIVAYDLPGNRFLADGAALYAQPNDEGDFARKIAQLMGAEELRRQMGAAGRRRVEEQLNWECSARVLNEAYQRLLPRASSPVKLWSR